MKDSLRDERMKILELLSKGIISVEDSERLLNAIGDSEEVVVLPTQKKAPFRMLKIFIEANDGDDVKIQIPVEFAKLLKSGNFDFDLEDTGIDIDSLLEMINSGSIGEIVNIKTGDGDTVRIFVE